MGYSLAHRFRVYPTTEQRTALAQAFGCARYVYNWGLEQRTRAYYHEGRSLSYTETAKMLTHLKKQQDTRWLSDVSSVVLQQSLRKAQRRLCGKEKGSSNYRKQCERVARLHARIADKRKDFLHKLSRRVVDENQVIRSGHGPVKQ